MSTTMPKAGEISRKWYVLDAADKPLGRTAALAAHILNGKHKPTYTPVSYTHLTLPTTPYV